MEYSSPTLLMKSVLNVLEELLHWQALMLGKTCDWIGRTLGTVCSYHYHPMPDYPPLRNDWGYWAEHDKLYPGGSHNSHEWQILRLTIMRRDGYRCRDCGRQGRWPHRRSSSGPYVGLHVHHIHPLSRGGSNNPANLITLCINCHERRHGRRLRGARLRNN